MKKDNNISIEEQLKKIQVELKGQEHRITKILLNIRDYGFDNSDEDKRTAVWMALIGYFLRQRTITIVISLFSGIGFCISTYILYTQNHIIETQNELIKIQTRRLDQQTYLQEAERRSSYVFQLGNILDAVDREIKEDVEAPTIKDLTPELQGRIIALSKALRPYRYLDGDSLIMKEVSPERGQLLVALLSSELSTNTLLNLYLGVDFSYADLSYANINHFDLQQSNMRDAYLDHSYVLRSNFFMTNLINASFKNASIEECNFTSSRLNHASFRNTNLSYSNFKGSTLEGTDFKFAILNGTVFDEEHIMQLNFDSVYFANRNWIPELIANSKAESKQLVNYLEKEYVLSMDSLEDVRFGHLYLLTKAINK